MYKLSFLLEELERSDTVFLIDVICWFSCRFRRFLTAVCGHKYFDYAVLFFILISCVVLALEEPNIPSDHQVRELRAIMRAVWFVKVHFKACVWSYYITFPLIFALNDVKGMWVVRVVMNLKHWERNWPTCSPLSSWIKIKMAWSRHHLGFEFRLGSIQQWSRRVWFLDTECLWTLFLERRKWKIWEMLSFRYV